MDTRLFLSRLGHPIYTFTTKSLTISQNKIDLVFLADSLTEDFYNLIANKIDISVKYDSRITYQTNSSAATFVIDSAETLDDGTVNVTAHILIECFPCSLIRRMVELGVDNKEIKKLIQQVQ